MVKSIYFHFSSLADLEVKGDLIDQLRRAIEGNIRKVVTELEEESSLKEKTPDSFHYLHHNRMNLSTKSNFLCNEKLPSDVQKVIVEMHFDFFG